MFDLLLINAEEDPPILAAMDAVVGARTAIHMKPGTASDLYLGTNADALLLQRMTAGDSFGCLRHTPTAGWLLTKALMPVC